MTDVSAVVWDVWSRIVWYRTWGVKEVGWGMAWNLCRMDGVCGVWCVIWAVVLVCVVDVRS